MKTLKEMIGRGEQLYNENPLIMLKALRRGEFALAIVSFGNTIGETFRTCDMRNTMGGLAITAVGLGLALTSGRAITHMEAIRNE